MLQKLRNLCHSHAIAYPVECVLNQTNYTCYNYGPLGARLRRNIANEWWKSCARTHGNIHLVENASIDIVPKRLLQTTDDTISSKFLSSLSKGVLKHYLPTLNQVRSRLPFGLAQISRGTQLLDIDCDHFIYSSAEQTELTLHFYVPPSESSQWMDKWQSTRLQWWAKFSKTPSAFTVPEESCDTDSATKTISIQHAFPWGVDDVESIRNVGNQPLADIEDILGVSLQGQSGGGYVLPDVLEVHTTVERAMAAFLCDAYQETDVRAKEPNHRPMLKLHPRLAPFYVAVVDEDTGNYDHNEDLAELARNLAAEMRGMGISVLEVANAATQGANHTSRYDETGVMWTVMLTVKTLEGGVALLRNRDTTIKERISIADLCKRLMYHLNTS